MATIAIISQKGGAGKTTLAAHLASEAHAHGKTALIIDTDPQATASTWGTWRNGAAPEVIDSPPPRLAAKIDAAKRGGADFIVIDTPPHADNAASVAIDLADLVLIPCRPSGFDLDAVVTTARLVEMRKARAAVVWMAGQVNAPRIYAEVAELVKVLGLDICPHQMPERAAFRHATGAGQTAREYAPGSKAAGEAQQVYLWTCEQVNVKPGKVKK